MIIESHITVLQELRRDCLRWSKFYQKLSVSPEHWHTERKEAYRDSAISMRKQSAALWTAIQILKQKTNKQ